MQASLPGPNEVEVFDRIRDVYRLSVDSRFPQGAVQCGARRAHERMTILISLSPGCSPTNIKEVRSGPSPNTVWLPLRWSSHAVHSLATAAKTGSAATRADFKSGTSGADALGARCHLSREALSEAFADADVVVAFVGVGVGVGLSF